MYVFLHYYRIYILVAVNECLAMYVRFNKSNTQKKC